MAVCGVLALASCNQDKKSALNPAEIQNDSLRSIISARDNEINDMMGTLNNIQFIAQRVKENRVLIKKLQQQLRETGFKGDAMKKTLSQLTNQLSRKETDLKQLRAELESKNIHIKELDETITGLNTDVATLKTDKENLTTEKENLTKEKENLQTESNQKTETINTQDKQLNTGWYVFGTKSELKAQRILDGGKVLQGAFNKNYFTKIDIRVNKEIKLYSKSVRLLTAHPGSSYTLTTDTNGQYVLRITDPQTFWSTSKYLVVQVR